MQAQVSVMLLGPQMVDAVNDELLIGSTLPDRDWKGGGMGRCRESIGKPALNSEL